MPFSIFQGRLNTWAISLSDPGNFNLILLVQTTLSYIFYIAYIIKKSLYIYLLLLLLLLLLLSLIHI